jgi:serine protease inhibitor
MLNPMKTNAIIFILCLACVFTSCKKESSSPAEVKPVQLTEKQRQLVDGSNSFGFDFFRKVAEVSGSEKNLMVSPLSVSMAFGMVRNGAAGSTLDSITHVLGMSGMTDAEINESFKYILETFGGLDPKVKLAIANSIWYRNTFMVEQPFIETNREYFNAEVNALDFSNPGAVNTINDWVSENTNQLIPKILDQIPDDMVMYLINAVYFKGQWKYTFDQSQTKPGSFYLSDGSTIEAPTMVQHAGLKYLKTNDFEAVELPYNQGNYNMVVLLPSREKSVNDVIGQLSQDNWNNWWSRMTDTDIQIYLPKFKFSYDESRMIPILSAMGMSVAFDSDVADFTRINSNGGLVISQVKHKTYIETNEEGTEAAAVTSIGIEVTSEPSGPYNLAIDRPFVFFISEKTTGSILFIGTLMNPLLEE